MVYVHYLFYAFVSIIDFILQKDPCFCKYHRAHKTQTKPTEQLHGDKEVLIRRLVGTNYGIFSIPYCSARLSVATPPQASSSARRGKEEERTK